MEQLYDAIEMCHNITTTNEECDFLSSFISCIMYDNDEDELALMESKEKLFFKEVIHSGSPLKCNFEKVWECLKNSEVKWKVAEELDWFVFYLFLRRFGWPDLQEENGQLRVALPDSEIKYRKSSKIEELKYKAQLVDFLDNVLLWLSNQPVSTMSVLMYSSAIRLASKTPVTRLHLSIRGSDWLKDNLTKDINDKLWRALQEFLILGVTDMWSRIRDASITRLGPIVEFLQLPQILSLFDELILLCDSNQWQVNDGAISAIGAILRRFQKIGYRSNSLQSALQSKLSSPRMQCRIKIGDVELDKMPPLLMYKLKNLVLSLIYHQQQTIRDNAIKAFVLCLDRYADHEIDTAFQDIYQRLSNRSNGPAVMGNVTMNVTSQATRLSTFMDPYGAQSLICLCQHLFKRVQDKISYLENWYHYHCSFDLYLCHPASSVRLVTSNLYKYAISQSISHPLLAKNILYYLTVKWSPDQSILLMNITSLIKTIDSHLHKRLSITKRDENTDESSFWEWREGRLLVYELFAKLIIKNHLWYTFGTTEVESVYSSENVHSRRNGSTNIDISPNESNLNLCDSGFALNSNKFSDPIDDSKLSASLDSRRMTFAGISLPSLRLKSNIKAISIRRNSHDITSNKSNNDTFINKITSARKINTSTSTHNIRTTSHSSFLVQVKEMEDLDDELINSQSSSSSDSEKKLPTFRSLLSQMLHTSAQSLIDSQWELRRMAKQTLPPLGEVLRWFDPGLLVNIISTHLNFQPTLMTSVSLALLHDALLHTSRLKQLLIKPPSSWQPLVATRIVHNLVTSVETNLPEWIKSCQHYLDRSTVFDCITPITMNIVITCINSYGHLVQVSNLSKSVVDAFLRLDKCIKSNNANITTITSFDLYPSLSCGSSDNPSLDYAVQLVDYLKDNIIKWWHSLLQTQLLADKYDQHKEAILSCSRLLPILAGWLHQVSEMRGDNSRYLRDILKLLHLLPRLLFDAIAIDPSSRIAFHEQIAKMVEVFSKYILCKELKSNYWWLRQLLDVILTCLDKFSLPEIDQRPGHGADGSPLLPSIIQSLLQRLHSSSSHRRATVCSIAYNGNPIIDNQKRKRHSIDQDHPTNNIPATNPSFIQSELDTNIELYSSQGVSDNIEYISDESINASDEEKTVSNYLESHVLNTPRHCSSIHPIQQTLDYGINKRHNFVSKKAISLQIPSHNVRREFKEEYRRSSTESEDDVEGSDWDSSTESVKSADMNSGVSKRTGSDDTVFVSELIHKLMNYNPNLFEQCKSILSEMDITILKGMSL